MRALRLVVQQSWSSSLDNLKAVRELGGAFLARLRSNRLVNPGRTDQVAASEVEMGPAGRVVQLRGYGLVRLFRTVSQDGPAEYWARSLEERSALEWEAWGIESHHRSLKQHCGAERSQVRSAVGQGNQLLLSVRAYLRLEGHRVRTEASHFEAIAQVIRSAIRSFLAEPTLARLPTA